MKQGRYQEKSPKLRSGELLRVPIAMKEAQEATAWYVI